MHLPQLGNKGSYLVQKMNDKLVEHKQYIAEYGQGSAGGARLGSGIFRKHKNATVQPTELLRKNLRLARCLRK